MFKVKITQRVPDVDWKGNPYYRKEHLEVSFSSLEAALSFVSTVLSVVPFTSAEIKKEEDGEDEENDE